MCLLAPPSGAKHPVTQTIDTGAASTPCEPLASNSDPACVLSGDTISIDQGVTITVAGSRPLVLIAPTEIDLNGTIDVASYAGGKIGPDADLPGCNLATGPNHTGGGAGGSWATKGGDGGDDQNDPGSHGMAGPTVALQMRGGCRGQDGTGGGAGGGAGGAGGGALVLITATIAMSNTGIVDASGAGGGGGPSGATSAGGGGGGTGGLVVLSASSVTIYGSIFANGGGGGAGTDGGNAAPRGTESSSVFDVGNGGQDPDNNGGSGGNGYVSGSMATNGGKGQNNDGGGGGGGGGAGYIHVPHGVTVLGSPSLSPPPQ